MLPPLSFDCIRGVLTTRPREKRFALLHYIYLLSCRAFNLQIDAEYISCGMGRIARRVIMQTRCTAAY